MLFRSMPLFLCLIAVLTTAPAFAESADDWVAPMRKVHARFRGISGSCAHFGDSLTETLAYWSPLPHGRKGASPELQHAYEVASARLALECWRDWKGPRFGSRSGAGIGWARANVDEWLKTLNPEVAVILFGTNDLGQADTTAYAENLLYVLQQCIKNGTVPILTTIPPRRDAADRVAAIVAVQRELARKLQIPLIDLHAEILQRRPTDWDGGKLPASPGEVPEDGHDVLTLIAADGVHLSHPIRYRGDYSPEALRCNGYALRTALSLQAYADVVEQVFEGKTTRRVPVRAPATVPVVAQETAAPPPAVRPPPSGKRTVAQRFGTHFSSPHEKYLRAPRLTQLPLPDLNGAYAVWGATGRDDAGNVYVGVSTWNNAPSAHLLKLSPGASQFDVAGDVIAQLSRSQTVHDRESQNKIHSKICEAADGAVYFASMDEEGEAEDGSKLPVWGGHLWRIRPGETQWEHLFKTPEALIAVGTTGRYVYALGYFNHVLYQFDTVTGTSRSIVVGSQFGHISRNFLVDLQEHVYVPRVEAISRPASGDRAVTFIDEQAVKSWLIELDTELREVGKWPLPDYNPTRNSSSHGIVGFAPLHSGRIVFTTHSGAFWCLTPARHGPAVLERLGWFHPAGPSYASALYCPTGRRFVCGLAAARTGLDWVVYDMEEWNSRVVPFDAGSRDLLQRGRLNIYGTSTMDDLGRGYLAGNADMPWGAFVLKVEW